MKVKGVIAANVKILPKGGSNVQGLSPGPGRYFSGLPGDCKLWNRALQAPGGGKCRIPGHVRQQGRANTVAGCGCNANGW